VDRVAREGREVWAKRVARWQDSGLTAKEFAVEVGVNPHTLAHWGWRLGGEASRRRNGTPKRAAEWIEVSSGGAGNEAGRSPATGRELTSGFELALAGGRTLRVPIDFNAEALIRLLAVLDAL
jgi:hypothetical protein